MKRLFSGIQPSGTIHIGNYFGAISNWIKLLDKYDCIFCIVDYHAITIPYDKELMQKRIFDAAVDNISAGLDPEKCKIFVQSHVSEHTELAWILSCFTRMGELSRMTQYKQKSEQHKAHANCGLFTYPILMTADIAIYKGEVVPVGEDQIQHVELAREIIRNFNTAFDDILPEPSEILSPTPRIMGLDADNKMSKSLNNHISLTETDEDLWKKLAPSKTDTNRQRLKDPGDPAKCNLFSYHKLVSSDAELKQVIEGCTTASMGCFDCKKILCKNFSELMGPIRDKKEKLMKEKDYVLNVLNESASKCRKIAKETISEIKGAMGL